MMPDWNHSPDFHVLFLPRSGSHMLVDALNSHPAIDCTHSDQGHHGEGNLKGHAQCVVNSKIKMAIVLTRNSKDRMDSFFTNIAEVAGDNHTKKPIKVKRQYPEKAENRYRNQEIKNIKFREAASKLPNTLFLDYDDITGNQDIREIPKTYSHAICDFLGVERRILKTIFVKPQVVK